MDTWGDNSRFLKPLESAHQEIVSLAHIDDVFWQFQALLDGEPRSRDGGTFQKWIATLYVDSVAARIRRLADRTHGTFSLWRLLDAMRSDADQFTLERFIRTWGDERDELAAGTFYRLAGAEVNCLTKQHFIARQRLLKDAVSRVERLANDRIVHLTDKPTTVPLTFKMIRKAIIDVFDIFRWCSLLLKASAPRSPVPVDLTSWLGVFQVAWLPESGERPKYQTLDQLADELAGR